MKRAYLYILLTFSILFLNACVTQKRKGDAPFVTRAYQNITTKYNYLFNANNLLAEGEMRLNQQHQDNYSKVLSLYPYTDTDNAQSITGDMDNAIKKMSVAISIHPVSHWKDDCYLNIAKAQYLKSDYEGAEESLMYMLELFDPNRKHSPKDFNKVKEGRKKELEKVKEEDKKAREKEKASAAKEREQDKKLREREKVNTAKERERERKAEQKAKEQERKEKIKQREKERKEKAKLRAQGIKTAPATPAAPKEEAKKEDAPTTETKTEEKPKSTKTPKTKTEKDITLPTDIVLDETGNVDILKSKYTPQNYFFKHRPNYQETQLWLARTQIERKKYDEADFNLRELEKNTRLFKDLRAPVAATRAYLYLKQAEYKRAIKPLEQTITLTKNRKDKARFTFILGQLYELEKNNLESNQKFEKTIKLKPSYELAFNARLKLAKTAWKQSGGSISDGIAVLEKMLKDFKNQEYKGQIYYALAELALENNDRLAAINYLKSATASQDANLLQRAESYLKLADLYVEDEHYVNAKNYFDSTLTFLPKNEERFPRVERMSANLSDIAANLVIIQTQDSILRVSNMSATERKELAKAIAKKEKEAKDKAEIAAAIAANNARNANETAIRNSIDTKNKSDFFAYNSNEMKQGKKDFEKTWGDRLLEDNWRRSNKKATADFENKQSVADNNTNEDEIVDVDAIFKNIPKTEEEKQVAGFIIRDAMLQLGKDYRDKLGNNKKAAETLENYLKRFPDSPNEQEAYYYLYLAYQDIDKPALANTTADKLIERFPNSEYAKIIKDPNYAETLKKEKMKVVTYYDEAYKLFQSKDFKAAYDKLSNAENLFPSNQPLKPKYSLLMAMCLGNLKGKEQYILALRDIVVKYPQTAEQKRAVELLRLLGSEGIEKVGGTSTTDNNEPKESYEIAPDKIHYIILVVMTKDADLTTIKANVSDYNRENYANKDLKMTNVFLDPEATVPILVLRKFENKTDAMSYVDGVNKNKNSFLKTAAQYELFAITQDNYRKVLTAQKISAIDHYRQFFIEEYLNK